MGFIRGGYNLHKASQIDAQTDDIRVKLAELKEETKRVNGSIRALKDDHDNLGKASYDVFRRTIFIEEIMKIEPNLLGYGRSVIIDGYRGAIKRLWTQLSSSPVAA